MTDLLTRLLALTELAVTEALENDYGDLEDRYIWRELQELKPLVAAATTQPETQEPTNEELLELMPETMRDEFSYAAKVCSDATGGQVKPGIFRVCLNHTALDYARAVLARWGHPAPLLLKAPY